MGMAGAHREACGDTSFQSDVVVDSTEHQCLVMEALSTLLCQVLPQVPRRSPLEYHHARVERGEWNYAQS
ncbi:hypothetical protein FA13DRAFT_1723586 [Coprinellus micaceus]|uniref:Uncharacterized protein n=1 Tax=Coprinellus micaceus TaxID=71717 RepID=A0A4Y7TZ07_COPMI|nr:hypothetical protein FA13DRAFT_1723586 [Coprinellus micaceus]